MARPVKWSRDLHPIRERAARSRTETWSRLRSSSSSASAGLPRSR